MGDRARFLPGRLLQNRQRQLQAYRAAGLANSSRQVLAETLNVIGMTWMRDTTLNDTLLAQLSDVLTVQHHRFGIVAQETGYYIDIKAQLGSSTSRRNDAAARDAYFKAQNFLDSALEPGRVRNNAFLLRTRFIKKRCQAPIRQTWRAAPSSMTMATSPWAAGRAAWH